METEILQAVRVARSEGLSYDEDVNRYVASTLGIQNTRELGRSVYQAKNIIKDKDRAQIVARYLAQGYLFASETTLTTGQRYMVRSGIIYVGSNVAEYGKAVPMRVEEGYRGLCLVKKGHRATGIYPDSHTLMRLGWADES